MSQSVGMDLLASVVAEGGIATLRNLGLSEDMLKPSEAEVYEFVIGHIKDHAVIPALGTIEDEIGVQLSSPDEPPSFYMEGVKKRWLTREMGNAMKLAQSELKNLDPQSALQVLATHVTATMVRNHGQAIHDFRFAAEPINAEYKAIQAGGDEYGIRTGWETLDNMMGAAYGGDMISFVGRPAMGKTWKILKTAHYAWHTQGHCPLVITTEMKPLLMMQRLAAMHAQRNLTGLKNATYSTKTYDHVINELVSLEDAKQPFWIVDASAAGTIEDIWLLCRQLNPSGLWVDGAYLLKDPNNPRAKKWEKITNTAEGIKDIATDLNIPSFASYQMNRESTKKKKDESPGVEDIAGADAIGQISSVVMGLLEDDTVETLDRRKVSILKGRSGETGEFFINWDFQMMNFDEVPAADAVTDLQYI